MNPEFHKCPDCGHKWLHGQDGIHPCRQNIMKQRDDLLAVLEKQFADAKHCQQVMLNEVGIGFLDVVTLDASEEAIARMKGAA